MIYAKIQQKGILGFGEEDFLKFLPYMGMAANFVNGKMKQEAHGPRFAHLSDIATADMQMFPIIYAKIQP